MVKVTLTNGKKVKVDHRMQFNDVKSAGKLASSTHCKLSVPMVTASNNSAGIKNQVKTKIVYQTSSVMDKVQWGKNAEKWRYNRVNNRQIFNNKNRAELCPGRVAESGVSGATMDEADTDESYGMMVKKSGYTKKPTSPRNSYSEWLKPAPVY